MLGEPAPGTVCPGVKFMTGGSGRLFEEGHLTFQVCIQDGAPHIVLPQAAGQPCNPARRLAGLRDGGMDQEKVGDVFSPYFGGTQLISWWILSHAEPTVYSRQPTEGICWLLAVGWYLSPKISFDKAQDRVHIN